MILPGKIHHGEDDQNRRSYFDKLGRQVQIPFQVCRVNNIDNNIRPAGKKVIPGDSLVLRRSGHGINSRQIDKVDVPAGEPDKAFLFFNRNAGPVSYPLVSPCEEIKNRCFTAVGVADNGRGFLIGRYFILQKISLY
jgi:hypothetical protein